MPGSLVFTRTPGPVDLRHLSLWWTWTPGASWRHPDGPASSTAGREDEPVVHVAYEDAEAYSAWAGKQLPTEAEWGAAARGGLEACRFTWGDEPRGARRAAGQLLARRLSLAPGRGLRRASAGRLVPGQRVRALRHCRERLGMDRRLVRPGHDEGADKPCCTAQPARPDVEQSYDPAQPQFRIPRKVIKGGSYLCADSYCQRYRPAARRPQMIDTGMSHTALGEKVAGEGKREARGCSRHRAGPAQREWIQGRSRPRCAASGWGGCAPVLRQAAL